MPGVEDAAAPIGELQHDGVVGELAPAGSPPASSAAPPPGPLRVKGPCAEAPAAPDDRRTTGMARDGALPSGFASSFARSERPPTPVKDKRSLGTAPCPNLFFFKTSDEPEDGNAGDRIRTGGGVRVEPGARGMPSQAQGEGLDSALATAVVTTTAPANVVSNADLEGPRRRSRPTARPARQPTP